MNCTLLRFSLCSKLLLRPLSLSFSFSSTRFPVIHKVSLSFTSRFTTMSRKPFERLPANVVPKNYDLTLQPSLTEFTFSGKQVVEVEVTKATNKVVLNSLDIKISSVKFTAGSVDLSAGDITYSKEDETATILFSSELPVGKGNLYLDFTGELNDKMKGFYRSKYLDDGKEKYCAVTQFEPTDARRAFPCWDEPSQKATFDVTLVVPKDLVALSNMNVIEEKQADDDKSLKVVKYARTPVMSTYLLAFVVGEYDYVEDKDKDGVLVRVYTPKGKAVQGKFALEVAVQTLPFYKDYFGISYPLPKMDLIAIADFAAGAMENWGLVTYRETALLVDPENSSSAAKQWVALVVGHEIAHQWFGNLVTMEWWTHLWLNEGFATWIEYLCVDHCFPEYDIWTQFVTTDLSRGINLDALKNSHPIEVPVGHPSEIDEIFDAISYSKGASVIRMLHHYIGDKDFKAGLHNYLNNFKYNNASTDDLWEYLAKASGKPVANIMKSWTQQMGFPVLSVKAQQKGNDKELTITQKKFCADGSNEGTDQLWHVPVSVITSNNTSDPAASTLLEKDSCTLLVSGVQADQWVKVNPGQVGFYRVKYESDMLELLLPAIRDVSLPPRDRLGLQSDLYALLRMRRHMNMDTTQTKNLILERMTRGLKWEASKSRAGLVPTTDFLKVIDAYSSEVNYTVWNDMTVNLANMGLILQYTDYHNSFGNFCLQLYEPIAKKLGWDAKKGEGHLDALLRGLVINRLGKYGHEATIKEAQKRFEAHCKKEATIEADLRSSIYSIVLKHGNEATLDAVEKLFREADLHEERVRLMRCMGSVTQPELIKRVLKFAISDDVRSQDTVFVIAGVTGSVTGRELAWQFVKDNWSMLNERYEGGFLLSRLVKSTTENFASEEKAKEVEEFFAKHSVPSAERTIQQSLEEIRLNTAWLTRNSADTKAWLQSKGF